MEGDVIDIDIRSNSKKLQADVELANTKAKELRKTLAEIEKDGGKGSENWQKYKNELKETQEQAKKLSNELKTMDVATLSMRQMELLLKDLNKEWKNMPQNSKEAVDQMKKIGEVEKQMKLVKDQADKIKSAAMGLAQPGMWTSIKSYMANAFSIASIEMVVQAIVNFTRESLLFAAKISDAFGDIRKSTGMTTQEVVDLNKAIHEIDTRTAQKELLDIAKVGGQINVAKEEMLGFVGSVDKAVVALGDEFSGGAEQVASTMGTLAKLFKETKSLEAGKAINDIGSAINELGAAGSATGPVVADFATRIGQLGKLAPAINQTLGLGAALQELGLTAEIAAGGLSNILLGATKATALYAAQIGVTEKEFKKLINSDPNEVILRLAKSFKGLPTDVVVKQMDALGIKSQEATKVMMLLSDKTDMVKEKQLLAAKAMKEGTSLTNEFNIKNNTAAAQLEKAGKMVDYLKERIGNFLIPVVLGVTTGFVALIKTLMAIPEFVEENKELFIGLGIAIISLNTANIAAATSALAHAAAEKGRAIATQSVTAAQWLMNAAMTANPIGIVVAAVSLLVGGFMVLYNHSEKVRAGVAALWEGLKATGTVIAQFGKALINMDFAGMAKAISEGGKTIGDAFMKGYQDKLDSEAPKVVAKHKDTVDKKVKVTKTGAEQAALDEINAAGGAGKTITEKEQAELDKRKAAKEKKLEEFRAAEEKYNQQINKDREKALELISVLEAEKEQAMATTSLEIEESKIREKARKRTKEIENSKADETLKAQAIEAINKNAEASLEKVREDYRLKRTKLDEEAAKKRLETETFIRDQEQKAEMTIFDWREQQAKGNATKLAGIQKERVDTELRLAQERIAAEMAAEQQKAISLTHDAEQLSVALTSIEDRYNIESLMATKKAADDKIAIDKDLHEKKAANLKTYSDMFASLLQGDVSGFMAAAGTMVKGHTDAWQQKLSADMASYEQGADMAKQAVAFLNNLAQKKAEKAIAEANRERDEKVAILTNELNITESLITSSSNFVTALKSAEKDRLAELQRILTDETSTEEQKRDAVKKYYSEQLQQMKEAEEAKIQDLQRLANQAKTEDERQAILAKIELAKKESAEKIRLAEEELASKKQSLNDLTEFTTETTTAVLAEANQASEKQINIASEEAEQKADFKADLEDTIAAENRKARATEATEKKKAFAAQKKSDIATALITGALAVLKALANFFPLNIILAATAAVVTGVQIAKIKNQPEPTFAQGGTLGHVPQGSKHSSIYGHGGIGLFDNRTGANVGEMEGGEAIISTRQTEANWPIIQQMFKNARTPGMSDSPVLKHPATPMAFRDGGKFESPYFERGMYLFGSKKRKAEQAAKDAEAEAAKAQAEADAAMGDYSVDTSGYNGIDGTDPASQGDVEGARAENEKAKKQGADQLKAIEDLLKSSLENGQKLDKMSGSVIELKSSVNGVEGAVNSVRDAVYNTNTQGKFDQLIGAISSMSA